MTATTYELSLKSLLSPRQIHILGAICTWFLILISPTLGLALFFPIAFLMRFDPELPKKLNQLYGIFHIWLWEPIWTRAGYTYFQGYAICTPQRDITLSLLVCLLFGIGIGVVGAMFQAWAIQEKYGSVSKQTIRWLNALWGTIFALMSVGSYMFVFVDYDNGCGNSAAFQLAINSVFIYLLALPIPIMFMYGFRSTWRLWRFERLTHPIAKTDTTATAPVQSLPVYLARRVRRPGRIWKSPWSLHRG